MNNKKVSRRRGFFPQPGPSDPIASILGAAGDAVAELGLEKLSREVRKFLGLSGIPIDKQLRLDQSRPLLERQVTTAKKADALSERRLKMYDLKIQEKELEIEKRRHLLEKVKAQETALEPAIATEAVVGALEVAAEAGGLVVSADQSEGYALWIDSIGAGKVILILGRRGSGKTALAAKIGEYMIATRRTQICWIGLPEQASELLPQWIMLVDSPELCPLGSLIIIDEAGIQYLSLAFNTDPNKLLRGLLMVCRHRHSSLVFAGQSSRDLEYSIVRQADTIIFKEPGLKQAHSERLDIRPMAKRASLAFSAIPRDKRREAAYVFDDDFEGFITSTVPSFWSEELSHIYAHYDVTALENRGTRMAQLQETVAEERKLLDSASLDKDILELRKQGLGIERIAKTLGCTTWTVRKRLEGLEQ